MPSDPKDIRWSGDGECPDDETLAALVDGALAPAVRAALETHLVGCDPCRTTVADSAEVLGALEDDAARQMVRSRESGRSARPKHESVRAKKPSISARAAKQDAAKPAKIIPLSRRASVARSSLSPSWIATAAAILLAGIGAGVLLHEPREATPPRVEPAQVARVEPGAGRSSAACAGASSGARAAPQVAGKARPSAPVVVEAPDEGVVGLGTLPTLPREEPAAVASTGASTSLPPLEAAPAALATISVASIGGKIEARLSGETAWHPLEPGTPLPAGASLRAGADTVEGEATEVVLDTGLALSLRRDTRAVIWPAKDGVHVVLTAGALAASPPPGAGALSKLSVETPQGTVRSTGGAFEVHVRRKDSLVVAREGGGVSVETPFGVVGVGADQHTVLLADRPSPPARALPQKPEGAGPSGGSEVNASPTPEGGREGPPRDGMGGGRDGRGPRDGREGGRRHHGPGGPGAGAGRSNGGHCRPPGGPEIDRLVPEGDGT